MLPLQIDLPEPRIVEVRKVTQPSALLPEGADSNPRYTFCEKFSNAEPMDPTLDPTSQKLGLNVSKRF